jgi:outer membrane protein assembly factor BamE (lipoprotein component of BamABCDE complex)
MENVTSVFTRNVRTHLLASACVVLLASGCMTASEHRNDIRDDSGDKLTVGKVQREVKVGMSSASVVEILGSPNVVTTDEKRREVWVYDKIASDRISSSSGNSLFVWGSSSVGASSSSQRTLTIIIKFDESSLVRDFAYHTSRF